MLLLLLQVLLLLLLTAGRTPRASGLNSAGSWSGLGAGPPLGAMGLGARKDRRQGRRAGSWRRRSMQRPFGGAACCGRAGLRGYSRGGTRLARRSGERAEAAGAY